MFLDDLSSASITLSWFAQRLNIPGTNVSHIATLINFNPSMDR